MQQNSLQTGLATNLFILSNTMIIVIKSVPSEVCEDCQEPFMGSIVTNQVLNLLNQLKRLQNEVSV